MVLLGYVIGHASLGYGWDPIGDLTHPERILRNIEREMRAAADEATRIAMEPHVEAGGHALAVWLELSRGTALRGEPKSMPNNVREKLKAFYDQDVLDRVKFKVGDAGVFNLGNLSIQYGGAGAVTLIDVIVFKQAGDVNNATLWAHELKHVEQFRDWGTKSFAVRYVRNWSAVENEAYEAEHTYQAWSSSGRGTRPYNNVLPCSNTYYYIRSDISGLFLDVFGASKDVGGKIVQALPNSLQQWQLIPSETPDYFYVQSKVSGLFLDVYLASSAVGGRIVQAPKHPAQVWKIIPALKPGYYYLQSKVSGLYLDVHAAAQTIGADIVQANRDARQIWSFTVPQ
jgi:hypothetical protein